jgi:hypothetical protein
MKGIIVILVLAAICAAIYLVAQWLRQRAADRAIKDAEWEIDERTSDDGTNYLILLTKPGEHDQIVGEPIYLGQKSWDFQEKLTERRIEAQDRADTLNRKDQL